MYQSTVDSALAAAWSLVKSADYATWFFEIIPGGIGVIVSRLHDRSIEGLDKMKRR